MDESALAHIGRTVAFLARTVESGLGGLSLTGYRLLLLVAQGDKHSSQLAGRLAISRPTVTYAVDTLVERGLLTRSRVEGDRRMVLLTLTPDGRDTLARVDREVATRLRPVFERLGNPDAVLAAADEIDSALAATRAEWVRRVAAKEKTEKKEPQETTTDGPKDPAR